MKKITLCAAALMLSVGLLAGCASSNEDAPSGEASTPTDNLIFDDIVVDEAMQAEFDAAMEKNYLPSVLDAYDVAGLEAQGWIYENGEKVPQYTLRYSFSNAGADFMHQGEEDWDGFVIEFASYSDEVNPIALATSYPGFDMYDLDVYAAGEYHAAILERWLVYEDEVAQDERVLSITVDEETGSKIFVTRIIREDFNAEIENVYIVSVETGFITEFHQAGYDLESGEITLATDVSLAYNEPLEFTTDPVADVFGGEDLCKVTVVFNPGQDSEEVQTFSVVKETFVDVVAGGEFELYGDAECTELCEFVDTTVDEATVYVKVIG